MSIEKTIGLRKRNAEFLRAVALNFRPPVVRGRRLEGAIDMAQIPSSPVETVSRDQFRLGASKLGGEGKLG